MNYQDAGVDIVQGDLFVERIKSMTRTNNPKVKKGIGGFAALYEISKDRYLASGTDGVGTKLLLAHERGIYDTIGIDLVAMCVNDIICTGAKPLFFLDYFATGKLDPEVGGEIIKGIQLGCDESEMALIGGETAEMPGVYSGNDFDLAGFAVGDLNKNNLIEGSKIREGDTLIGLHSSGVHSNGFSLVRKLLSNASSELKKQFLAPTKIYWETIKNIPNELINGLAHITGGGIDNVSRMNPDFEYCLDNWRGNDLVHENFQWIMKTGNVPIDEMYKTFNMGIGMVLATSTPERVLEILSTSNIEFSVVGKVQIGKKRVFINKIN